MDNLITFAIVMVLLLAIVSLAPRISGEVKSWLYIIIILVGVLWLMRGGIL